MRVGRARWHSQHENRVQMLAKIMAYAERALLHKLFQLALGHLLTTTLGLLHEAIPTAMLMLCAYAYS